MRKLYDQKKRMNKIKMPADLKKKIDAAGPNILKEIHKMSEDNMKKNI